ncbi:MAG: hypothetical protein ABSG89_10590 [Bacteroidales bacterium]|jgi:glycosyltransferase involved in cell wall biosynthesis
MDKVLIITYYWPPSGGAGVQRWLKFSKYLPGYGWEPVILTVIPEYASYPAIDHSLEKEIPDKTRVYRTKATDWFRFYGRGKKNVPTAGFAKNDDNSFKGRISRFIRGNFFVPDPRRGWNKFAIRKASELISREHIMHLVTSSPPHSTQLIGLKLKKKFPFLKWIADLRDPWTDIYYYDKFYPGFLARILDLRYERNVLKRSDRIITVGKSLKKSFSEITKGIEDKITVVTNGYDESDRFEITAEPPAKKAITYVGTISESYPVAGLISALKNLSRDKVDFTIQFAGDISDIIKESIKRELAATSVEFIPYMDHETAVRFIMESSILVLIIPDHRSNKSILTGKLFEYLASGNHILCLGPADGDAADIIDRANAGRTFEYYDIEGISGFLIWSSTHPANPDMEYVKEFSRFKLTEKLLPILME